MSDLDDIETETRLPDIHTVHTVHTEEYENILDLLANDNSLTYNYALSETIRLMENLAGRPEEETNDNRVIDFASKAAKYLSEYRLTYYHESTIAQLELLLHAMSSVLHVLSSVLMIQAEVRASLYKSVSNFWASYRKARFTDGNINANIINANIIFRLREIRNCLCSRIRGDQSGASAALKKTGNAFDVVVNVLQKEYLAAFGAFFKVLDFEYSAGEWYYDWEDNREKYFVLSRKCLENDPEINDFYKKLYKSSRKEFARVMRKNTKYRNFEYKILKSGGVMTGSSLPDNIDTLLIGYLHLIQQLLEEPKILTQIDKKYIRKTITLCTTMVDNHVKKLLTFKALEVLFVIKQISENDVINEIEFNIEKWSTPTPTTPLTHSPRSLSSPPYFFSSRPLSSPPYSPSSRPLSSPSYPPSSQNAQYDILLTSSPTTSKFPYIPPTPTSEYSSFSTPPPSPFKPPPTTSLSRKETRQKRLSLNNVREIPTKVTTSLSNFQIRYPRKRIIDNVRKLFNERRKIVKGINEINEIKEKYNELEKNESIDTNSLLLKLKEMLDESKSENNFSKVAVKYIDREIIRHVDIPPQPLKDDNIDKDSFFLKLKDILKENIEEIKNKEMKIEKDIDDSRKGVEGIESESESDIHDEIDNNNDGTDNNKSEIDNNKDEIDNNNDGTDNNKSEIDNNKDEIDNIKDEIDNNNDEIDNSKDEIDNEDNDKEKEESKEVEDNHDVKSLETISYEEIEVEISTSAEQAIEEMNNTEEIITNVDNSQVVENNNLDVEKEREIEIENNTIKQDEKLPDIIVYDNNEQVEINPHLNEESNEKDEKVENPTIINQYVIHNNYTQQTQQTQLDVDDSNLIKRALKKIVELVESVEYIADRAAKGRQDALRLSNNVSSSSVNIINEDENEVKKVENENENVEKVEEKKEVEKVEISQS